MHSETLYVCKWVFKGGSIEPPEATPQPDPPLVYSHGWVFPDVTDHTPKDHSPYLPRYCAIRPPADMVAIAKRLWP